MLLFISKKLYNFSKDNSLLFKKCLNTLSIPVSRRHTAGRFRFRSLVFPRKTQQELVLLAVLSHSEILESYQWQSGSLLCLVLHNPERRKRNAIYKLVRKSFCLGFYITSFFFVYLFFCKLKALVSRSYSMQLAI